MPLETSVQIYEGDESDGLNEVADNAMIFDQNGNLTLECRTIASFLEDIDYDAFFEDEELRAFVSIGEGWFREQDGRMVPCEETDEGAELLEIETVPGEVVAELIDEADLSELFSYYMNNEYPNESMEDRLALSLFEDVLTESPFKKGGLRAASFKGASGGNERHRMMMAMIKKGAITRVAKGKGYKGGDYKKGPHYKKGPYTPAYNKLANNAMRAKRVSTFVKKHGGIEPDRKSKIMPVVYKNLHSKMPKNWIPPEKRLRYGKAVVKGKPMKVTLKKAKVTSSKKAEKISKQKALFGKKKSVKESMSPRMVHESIPANGPRIGPHLVGLALHGKSMLTARKELQTA